MDGYDGGIEGVLGRAAGAGVTHVVAIGAGGTAEEAEGAIAAARRFVGVSAITGIHPHDAKAVDGPLWARIEAASAAPEVVAVGETGLDFHYDLSDRAVQAEVFRRHIDLARRLGKPLCIHCRNAEADTLAILVAEGAREVGGVIHCFSGSLEFAHGALDLGFYLSVPGIVTFKKAGDLPAVVQFAPADRLLIETDAPFLAPMPYRGKRNEPMYVVETLRKVAALRCVAVAEAEAVTDANATRLFGVRLAVPIFAPA
ncbi:MAG: TatD family deoxyribonuclease [Myxococcales bacterium]|nr:TatD family deoxyribonuclease [Myxococcales bacterium]